MGSRKKAGPPPPMNLNMNVGKQHPSLTGWNPHQSQNPMQPPKSQKQKDAIAIAIAKKKGKPGGY